MEPWDTPDIVSAREELESFTETNEIYVHLSLQALWEKLNYGSMGLRQMLSLDPERQEHSSYH